MRTNAFIRNSKRLMIAAAVILLSLTAYFAYVTIVKLQPSYAANGSNFDAGRIIDDSVFYNSGTMSASQIQSFLNSKVPTCDTNGTGIASEFGSTLTRAQYAASRGWQSPPYTCLKDYSQKTPQMEAASGYCGAIPAYNSRSAASIIKDVADACGINPQVLVVLLDKEQSLVTDIWPLNKQYNSATGFACPDTAPCDSGYGGFFYQVYYAARQFKVYQAHPNNYNYIAGRTNRIYWQTNLGSWENGNGNYNSSKSTCGYSNVYIQNQATAALYIYTPYRPNQKALENLYGTGDGCSAYGNRNFWRLFTDWFGSTKSNENRQNLTSKATNTLTAGQTLKSGEFLTSPNGKYIFVMHPSGQLFLYQSKNLLWQSSSVNWAQEGASMKFQTDSNMVIYGKNGALWGSDTVGLGATRLVLQDDGNLVMYNASNAAVWASQTSRATQSLTYMGSSLETGARLSVGQYLRSPDWRYYLVMQTDGNLVLYTAGYTQAIWHSETDGKGGKFITMQSDGNLVIYGDKGAIWGSGTDSGKQEAFFVLQSDGNMVIYSTKTKPLWGTSTDGKGGKYVTMQSDGNLVIYGDKGAIWGSGTSGRDGTYITPQTDGNVVIYGTKGAIWGSDTARRATSASTFSCTLTGRLSANEKLTTGQSLCSPDGRYLLVMQSDGNLVLYTKETTAPWGSSTNGVFFKSDFNL